MSGKEQISRAFEERGSPLRGFNYGWRTWKVRTLFCTIIMVSMVRASEKGYSIHATIIIHFFKILQVSTGIIPFNQSDNHLYLTVSSLLIRFVTNEGFAATHSAHFKLQEPLKNEASLVSGFRVRGQSLDKNKHSETTAGLLLSLIL